MSCKYHRTCEGKADLCLHLIWEDLRSMWRVRFLTPDQKKMSDPKWRNGRLRDAHAALGAWLEKNMEEE